MWKSLSAPWAVRMSIPDEYMEIDTESTTAINHSQDEDSDIEVIACYRETPIYPSQLVAGRAMTFDIDACGEERVESLYGPAGSFDATFGRLK